MDPLAIAPLPAISDDRALALRPESATPQQAAQRFEALFVAELLKSAQRPAFGGTMLSGGSAGGLYRDLFADELARGISERGSFGLARALLAGGEEQP